MTLTVLTISGLLIYIASLAYYMYELIFAVRSDIVLINFGWHEFAMALIAFIGGFVPLINTIIALKLLVERFND